MLGRQGALCSQECRKQLCFARWGTSTKCALLTFSGERCVRSRGRRVWSGSISPDPSEGGPERDAALASIVSNQARTAWEK